MTSASDIAKVNGQPALLSLEAIFDETVVECGIESNSPRTGYGLALPMPEEMYEAMKAKAAVMIDQLPEEMREHYEDELENLPKWCLVTEPLVVVWN